MANSSNSSDKNQDQARRSEEDVLAVDDVPAGRAVRPRREHQEVLRPEVGGSGPRPGGGANGVGAGASHFGGFFVGLKFSPSGCQVSLYFVSKD